MINNTEIDQEKQSQETRPEWKLIYLNENVTAQEAQILGKLTKSLDQEVDELHGFGPEDSEKESKAEKVKGTKDKVHAEERKAIEDMIKSAAEKEAKE